jgi:hypothetical protein
VRLVSLVFAGLLLTPCALVAQAAADITSTEDKASTNDVGPEGLVPLTRGFNASLVTTSQHDSSDGWSSILIPDLAYRFDQHFSLNLEVPVFPYVNVTRTANITGPNGVVTGTTTSQVPRHFLMGDSALIGSFDTHSNWLDYNLSTTLGIPTGDSSKGLGAGQVTYAVVNHFEHALNDYITPDLELGIDDSPNLVNLRVHKSFTDVGTSAHFQFGFGFSLPFDTYFETDAYEELPLSTQTVTSTTTKGKKGKKTVTKSQESIGEDNGFTNSLDIPLNRHITLSGFYNRSLRDRIDTAGFSLTFLLRGTRRGE